MKVYVLDTETTGFKDPVPMSMAYIPLTGGPADFSLGEGELFMYNPGKDPEFGAVATHHILPSMVADSPPWDQSAVPAMDFIIGHSVDYDWEVVGKPDCKRICTFALSSFLWPEVDSHKLGALTYFTRGLNARTRGAVQEAHGALADVYMAADLLLAITQHMKVASPSVYGLEGDSFGIEDMTWEDLWMWSEHARVPRVLTFGKNKGVKIESIDFHDPGYRSYMLRQKTLDHYVRTAFESTPQIGSCGCEIHGGR